MMGEKIQNWGGEYQDWTRLVAIKAAASLELSSIERAYEFWLATSKYNAIAALSRHPILLLFEDAIFTSEAGTVLVIQTSLAHQNFAQRIGNTPAHCGSLTRRGRIAFPL